MKTSLLFLAFLFLLGWVNAQPGYIGNIQVTQGTGEYKRVVDILFDLSGGDPLYYISLEISFDDGMTYDPVDPNEVNGSLTVGPGMGIHLVWDGRLSYPAITSDISRLKIIATTWQCGNPITDFRDGQIYSTVLIGTQCWMAENLNVGTMVVSSSPLTDNGTIEKYCNDNDADNCEEYGGLYPWDEAMNYTYLADGTGQGICPDGWHMPTDEEWKQLEGEADNLYDYPDPEWDKINDYNGYDAGANLKSSNGWNGLDLFGFTALPGGMYSPDGGSFWYYGHNGYWWTSTGNDNSNAWIHVMSYDWAPISRNTFDKQFGFSIRCLKDADPVEPPVWSCGDPIQDSRDNQVYETVEIGDQCWMAENLNIGTQLDSTTSPSNNFVIEKHCYHDLESQCGIYGGLYPWMEMMQYTNIEGTQGICPDGWHLPTWTEWWNMINFLGEAGGENGEPGGKLKEAGYQHWIEPNAGATNESGFTALPGGFFSPGYAYSFMGNTAKFWSSKEYPPNPRAGSFSLTSASESILPSTVTSKFNEFSVRCVLGQGASGGEEIEE